jgi:hypothetical protein
MPRISNSIIGAGGVFHVASVFSMRGLIALPTIKNTAAYDIIVTSSDGLRHANIQVKTSSARPGYWPICSKVSHVRTSTDDFYVLLRRTNLPLYGSKYSLSAFVMPVAKLSFFASA